MSAESVELPQALPKRMSTLQKVKLANQLIEAVESEPIKKAFMAMPQGEAIHQIFVEAAETRIESLMGNDVVDEELTLAQEKVDEIVNSCIKLQQALVQSVRQVVGGQQQRPPQQQQQQQTAQQRKPAPPPPQQAVRAIRKQPIYEEVQIPDSEDDALLY
jgi:hypothetical protein